MSNKTVPGTFSDTFLSNPWVKEDIVREVRKCFKLNNIKICGL